MDENQLRQGLNKLAAERDDETQSKQESINAVRPQIYAIDKKITNFVRTFVGEDDEDAVAGLRLRINDLKKVKAELLSK